MAQGLLKIALIKTKNPVKKIKQAATNKIYPAVFLAQEEKDGELRKKYNK